MKFLFPHLIFALFAIQLTGCNTIFGKFYNKEEEKKITGLEYPKELEKVNKMIAEEKLGDAMVLLNDYLTKGDNIHYFGHAYFLKAFISELRKDFDAAIAHYREAIQHSATYNSRVEAKALYNLSFVYERLDKMDKLSVVLLDLMKRRKFFDRLTGNVEIPARLSAVYAYMNREKEAVIFHREAANNFKKLIRKNNFRADRSEISKSLYYLGVVVFERDSEDFNSLVRKVGLGQKYLLASAEASKSEWSQKAANQLSENYNMIWYLVENYNHPGLRNDPLARKKRTQMMQLERASDLYDLTHRLLVEEFPMQNVNPRSKVIIDRTKAWQEKIETFARRLDLGPQLMRHKPVKQRRLVRYLDEPAPQEPVRINKETAKNSQQEEKKEKPVEQALPEKETMEKDPNL